MSTASELSTSFLPLAILGDQAIAFDADLAITVRRLSGSGVFIETGSFAHGLARKPT